MPTRLNAANNASTTLNNPMATSDASCSVASATGFPAAPFRVTIDTEIIEVGSVNGNVFSNLTRGVENTTPAAHASGASVKNIWTAGMYGELAAMIIGAAAPPNPPAGSSLFWLNTSVMPWVLNYWNNGSWKNIASGSGNGYGITNPNYWIG